MFFVQLNVFFHPNLRTLNMYALASFQFGFRRSNISKKYKNILCIRQNHVLVEFFQICGTCMVIGMIGLGFAQLFGLQTRPHGVRLLQKSLSLTKITHMNTGIIHFLICRRLLTFDNESKMLTW